MIFLWFLHDFLMGSKGFGKVPASKWCKMQQTHMLKPEIIKKKT